MKTEYKNFFSYLTKLSVLLVIASQSLALSGCGNTGTEGESRELTEADIPLKRDRVTRLFWQDREEDSLKWADLAKGEDEWYLDVQKIPDFPKLDVEKQDLVQMQILAGKLLVGVRDNDDGKFQSGWVAIDTGVIEEPHGDHSDWTYEFDPKIQVSRLNKDQGNPAHLYSYDGNYYLANDSKNGFTRLLPNEFKTQDPGTFHPGGGNHITMAAADNKVCYSTWIDGGGPNKGRVDVVDLSKPNDTSLAYTFHLPTGVIHGATVNSGRVFFAPADGICWTEADTELTKTPDSMKVHHISLGKDKETDKPLRTGSFANHRNWIIFTTGTTDSSALCLLNAESPEPAVIKVPIEVADGLSLVTPKVIQSSTGKRYAFVFQDRKEGEGIEKLTIIDIDPDGDRNFSDAIVSKTIEVGPSKIEGHHGHHSICFTPDGKYACLTNPGDGSIWVLSLYNLEILAKLQAGGTPSAITNIGGIDFH